MDFLTPSYIFVIELTERVQNGVSVRVAVESLMRELPPSPFLKLLAKWRFCQEQKTVFEAPTNKPLNSFHSTVFDILRFGYEGGSVVEPLKLLQTEMSQSLQHQLEAHIAQMPYRLMIPLVAFQFPALLLMILGPVFFMLIQEMSK